MVVLLSTRHAAWSQSPAATPDLTRPEALAQLREAVWTDSRRADPGDEAAWIALAALPSADAMALTAVSRPMFRIHEDIWTGRIRLEPTRDLEVVLVSHAGMPLATLFLNVSDDYVGIYYADDPDIAVRAAAMQPGEQLVERWPPIGSPPYWIVRGDQAEEIASVTGTPARTVPVAELVRSESQGLLGGLSLLPLGVPVFVFGLLCIALLEGRLLARFFGWPDNRAAFRDAWMANLFSGLVGVMLVVSVTLPFVGSFLAMYVTSVLLEAVILWRRRGMPWRHCLWVSTLVNLVSYALLAVVADRMLN